MYNGKLYKCTTATTGGTWVSGSWELAILSDDLQNLDGDVDDLKNAISQLQPMATASDVGKALIVKTVDEQTGKPTDYEYGEAGGGLSATSANLLLKISSQFCRHTARMAGIESACISASKPGRQAPRSWHARRQISFSSSNVSISFRFLSDKDISRLLANWDKVFSDIHGSDLDIASQRDALSGSDPSQQTKKIPTNDIPSSAGQKWSMTSKKLLSLCPYYLKAISERQIILRLVELVGLHGGTLALHLLSQGAHVAEDGLLAALLVGHLLAHVLGQVGFQHVGVAVLLAVGGEGGDVEIHVFFADEHAGVVVHGDDDALLGGCAAREVFHEGARQLGQPYLQGIVFFLCHNRYLFVL